MFKSNLKVLREIGAYSFLPNKHPSFCVASRLSQQEQGNVGRRIFVRHNMNESERVILGMVEDGRLSIDSEGRVWRNFQWINYRYGYRKLNKPTRAEITNGKYYELHIKTNGNEYRAKAHRIVWMHFNGKVPANRPFTNHKNGNGYDNRPVNLEMVTTKENTDHAYQTGLAHGRSGEKHHNCKLTWEKVRQIRDKFSRESYTYHQLSAEYGVGPGQIGKIIRKEKWIEAD